MRTPNNPNLVALRTVALALGPLRDEVVFVGGSVTSLLLTDLTVSEVRVTADVDFVVEVAPLAAYYQFCEKLKHRGFRDEHDAPVTCRYRYETVTVDVMPVDGSVLGFHSRWYGAVMKTAKEVRIDDFSIRIPTAVAFVATKLEAFRDRGESDYWASKDLEDVLRLVDGRKELLDEARAFALPDVVRYIASEFKELLATPAFIDALPAHFDADDVSQSRVATVLARLRAFAALK